MDLLSFAIGVAVGLLFPTPLQKGWDWVLSKVMPPKKVDEPKTEDK